MDKFLNIDIYQTLSYLMPGMALLVPVYYANSDWVNSELRKIGLTAAIVLLIPISLSIGVFLHAGAIPAQRLIEKYITRYDMMEHATKLFEYHELLRVRIQTLYNIHIDDKDINSIYIYSRTLAIKDGAALQNQAQFFLSLSVFFRSLILVALIIGVTVIFRTFRKSTYGLIYAVTALIVIIPTLVYFKWMYFRLSVHETLRAALLLTAQAH